MKKKGSEVSTTRAVAFKVLFYGTQFIKHNVLYKKRKENTVNELYIPITGHELKMIKTGHADPTYSFPLTQASLAHRKCVYEVIVMHTFF